MANRYARAVKLGRAAWEAYARSLTGIHEKRPGDSLRLARNLEALANGVFRLNSHRLGLAWVRLSKRPSSQALSLLRSLADWNPDAKAWVLNYAKARRSYRHSIDSAINYLETLEDYLKEDGVDYEARALPASELKKIVGGGPELESAWRKVEELGGKRLDPLAAALAFASGLDRTFLGVYPPSGDPAYVKRGSSGAPSRIDPEETLQLVPASGFIPEWLYEDLREKLRIPYNIETREGTKTIEIPGGAIVKGVVYVYGGLALPAIELLLRNEMRVLLTERGKRKLVSPALGTVKLGKTGVWEKLRDYQRSALRHWLAAGGRGVVAMPTGAGKTWVALAAIEKLAVPTLIVVPTKELMYQWAEKVREVLGVDPGLYGDDHKDVRDITVAIYNSAVKMPMELLARFDLHVYDEAHHLPAETFKAVALKAPARYRLALSATPERPDGNDTLLYKVVGPLVYKVSLSYLLRRGYLVPVVADIVMVPLPEELAKEYEKLEEEYKAASKAGRRTDVLRVYNKMKMLAIKNPAKLAALRDILAKHKNDKILVFAEYKDVARKALEVAEEVLGKGKAALILGDTPDKERKAAFKAFKEGRIKAIVTGKVLDEGVDVPDASVAVVLGGNAHPRQLIQRLGRVLRPSKGKKHAYFYLVISEDTLEHVIKRGYEKYLDEVSVERLAEELGWLREKRRKRREEAARAWAEYIARLMEDEGFRAIVRKRVKELTRRDLALLRRLVHRARPAAARKRDEMRTARAPKYVLTWVKNPGRYDIPGIDTAEVGKRRRARARAAKRHMQERMKAPIQRCTVKKTKNEKYAVICYHRVDGRLVPVMHGAYKYQHVAQAKAEALERKGKA